MRRMRRMLLTPFHQLLVQAMTRNLCLASIPAMLVQRRLLWFDHAARRPNGELIKDLFLPTPPRMWRRRTGGQLKAWATTIKAGLEPLSRPRVFGHARRRKDWVKTVEPGVPPSETWSTQLVMPAKPAPGECRHKYKCIKQPKFSTLHTGLVLHVFHVVKKCAVTFNDPLDAFKFPLEVTMPIDEKREVVLRLLQWPWRPVWCLRRSLCIVVLKRQLITAIYDL